MGCPCTFRSVAHFSPTPLFSIKNSILMSFLLFKARRHDAAEYGNVMPKATLHVWRQIWCLAPPLQIHLSVPCIFGTFFPQWEKNLSSRVYQRNIQGYNTIQTNTLFANFRPRGLIEQKENDNNDNLCKIHGGLYIASALMKTTNNDVIV